MCFAYGSIDQAISVCPMCKVFKPSAARCPHLREVCRNRALHPRHDVVYLKNAEVQSFNGCGFCKWARTSPPPKQTGYSNPGTPGCCRAPTPSEQRMISAADWPAVSAIHHIPIPPEIKSILDSLRGSPLASLTADRRNSGNSSPKSTSSGAKALPVPIPAKVWTGSPKQPDSSLASPGSRAYGAPSSLPKTSSVEHHQNQRRLIPDNADKRTDAPHSSHSSPIRKAAELETFTPKRDASRRPSVSNVVGAVAKLAVDSQTTPPALRRRSSGSSGSQQSQKSSPPTRSTDRPPTITVKTQARRNDSSEGLEPLITISSASSSSGSSDSLGSLTDGTVTTDGGFTDYLSEESEEELQRQAEAKAILVAQTQAEEQEFKAARQQLVNVDLHPPISWNPSHPPPIGQNNTQINPRSPSYSSYTNPVFASCRTSSQSKT